MGGLKGKEEEQILICRKPLESFLDIKQYTTLIPGLAKGSYYYQYS